MFSATRAEDGIGFRRNITPLAKPMLFRKVHNPFAHDRVFSLWVIAYFGACSVLLKKENKKKKEERAREKKEKRRKNVLALCLLIFRFKKGRNIKIVTIQK